MAVESKIVEAQIDWNNQGQKGLVRRRELIKGLLNKGVTDDLEDSAKILGILAFEEFATTFSQSGVSHQELQFVNTLFNRIASQVALDFYSTNIVGLGKKWGVYLTTDIQERKAVEAQHINYAADAIAKAARLNTTSDKDIIEAALWTVYARDGFEDQLPPLELSNERIKIFKKDLLDKGIDISKKRFKVTNASGWVSRPTITGYLKANKFLINPLSSTDLAMNRGAITSCKTTMEYGISLGMTKSEIASVFAVDKETLLDYLKNPQLYGKAGRLAYFEAQTAHLEWIVAKIGKTLVDHNYLPEVFKNKFELSTYLSMILESIARDNESQDYTRDSVLKDFNQMLGYLKYRFLISQ